MCLLTGAGKYYSSGNDLSAFAVALGEGMSPPELADMAFALDSKTYGSYSIKVAIC